MAYDENLAKRLTALMPKVRGRSENRMFGGFGYLLNGNMCVGINGDTLIVRVGIDTAQKILQEQHVRPMDFTGKVMKGWATIDPPAIIQDQDLIRFCQLAIDFVQTLPAK